MIKADANPDPDVLLLEINQLRDELRNFNEAVSTQRLTTVMVPVYRGPQ